MDKNLKDIDIKILKFLLSSAVYSELAIVKNLGITYEELENSYVRLEKNGYLESYEEYQKREKEECPSQENCSNCSKKSGACGGCCGSKDTDYSNVRVLTWKAIEKFQD